MIIIEKEDIGKFSEQISKVIGVLGQNIKRAECDITVGEDYPVAHLTGYWINNIIRLDIKFGD